MNGHTAAQTWNTVPAATALTPHYDATGLAAEVRALRARPWRAQRSIGQDGLIRQSPVDWTIIALRSPGGDPDRTDAGGAGLREHADTPHLSGAPLLNEVIRGFPTTLLAARLMALGRGARVGEHRDAKCGIPWGVVRLHIPIITNPGALVVIDGRPYHWDAGRLWFGDFNRLHYVSNSGDQARIHLVLDCPTSKELMNWFPAEVSRQLLRDEVLLAREAAPINPAEQHALHCRFRLPTRFTEWSEEEPVAAADATVAAAVTSTDEGLVLAVEGEPAFGLVHVGDNEFRLAGWTRERTLRLELTADRPVVHCTVRLGGTETDTVVPAEASAR